jgi:hypothetical protein
VVVVEVFGEASQAIQRASVAVLRPCGTQLMFDLLPVALWEVVEDVSLFVSRSVRRAPGRTRR